MNTVICPFGGGGCICGIGSVLKTMKPDTRILACEVETAAPLSLSLSAGHPTPITNHQPSFVDGMGGKSVFPQMWPLVSNLIDESIVLSVQEICNAVKMLAEKNCVVAEGAGAAPVAAALRAEVPEGNIVCIISGGNIDSNKLATILLGGIPE